MRLLVATDQWSPDAVGGSARVATATARMLAGRGHRVTVLAPTVAGRPRLERDGLLEVRRAVRRGPFPQTFADVVETWRLARRERNSFEVVLAHQATNASGLLAARLGLPLAYVFHASAPLEQRLLRGRLSPVSRAANVALHPFFLLLEHTAVRGADRILLLSDFSRELLRGSHPHVDDRVSLVSGGVDLASFPPLPLSERTAVRTAEQLPTDTPFLLTVRRLEPRMGLEELLHAARMLVDADARFTLGVAGAGMLAGELRELARRLGLGDRVRFFGRVSDERLRGLYGAADLFVLPTLAYEGFGIATVEALASGCPVVGTPVGATPELLTPLEPRLLAADTTPGALRDAIVWALGADAEGLRERCAAYARRYSWERVIDGWESTLEETASLRRPPAP